MWDAATSGGPRRRKGRSDGNTHRRGRYAARSRAATASACTSTRSPAPRCSTPPPRSSSPRPSRPACSPSTCSPTGPGRPHARAARPMTRHRGRARVARRGGPQGRRPVHQRQPAAGRLDRPQVRPRPDADARPDPGGQHRPDPGGREVRLRQGLQVLDVRHLVGAPGDHPRHRPAGPRGPAARARRRGAQPGRRRPPHPRAPARPRPRARGDRRPSSAWTSSGSST